MQLNQVQENKIGRSPPYFQGIQALDCCPGGVR